MGLGFRSLGFRVYGFRGLGFRVLFGLEPAGFLYDNDRHKGG